MSAEWRGTRAWTATFHPARTQGETRVTLDVGPNQGLKIAGVSLKIEAADRPLMLPGAGTISSPLRLLHAFLEREYECYDAIPVAQDSVLRPEDIAISILVNSQISGNTARAIWEARALVEEHLRGIPPDTELAVDGKPKGSCCDLLHSSRRRRWLACRLGAWQDHRVWSRPGPFVTFSTEATTGRRRSL